MRPKHQGLPGDRLVEKLAPVFFRLLRPGIVRPVPTRVFHQDRVTHRIRQVQQVLTGRSNP